MTILLKILALLSNPAFIGLAAVVLSVVWMLRDEKDRTRPALVIALVFNLIYGWLLSTVMGKEDGLVPWKYDYILFRLDAALGIPSTPIASHLQQPWERLPLMVVYQLMIPMMITWFLVVRRRNLAGALILTYTVELIAGPLLYAVAPGCGPLYAFRTHWLHPAAVDAIPIRLSGMPNAFPSLHVATAFVLALFAYGWKSRAASLVFLAGTVLATLSTGEHYVIDLVAGLAFGSFAASAGRRRIKPALGFGALASGWSLAVRFGNGVLLAHPWMVKGLAGITIIAVTIGALRPDAVEEPGELRQRA